AIAGPQGARRPGGFALLRRIGLFVALLPALAAATGLEHQDFTLDNGLRVVLVRESKAPVIMLQLWYRVGSVDEEAGKTGLSHMLEHMMFQGTPLVPEGEFHQRIGRNGGENNASTSHDFTNYYIKLASDRSGLALALEADRMRHLSLHESAFLSENRVVQEERRTRTDGDPNARFLEQFQAKAYGDHPYGRPIIGWMPEIQQLTVADLRAWYQRYYVPNNAVLVLVGAMDLATMAQEVREHFSGIPAAPTATPGEIPPYQPPPLPPSEPPPPQRHFSAAQRLEVRDPGVTLPLWHAGCPVPTLQTEGREDAFALDVLATVLGGDSNSRLHKKLVLDEGVAVSATASYGGYSRSFELFGLSVAPQSAEPSPTPQSAAPPQGAAALSHIEAAVWSEVDRLAREPVEERELQRAKNSMVAHHVFAQDSIHELASAIGLLAVNGLDWLSLIEGYPQHIAAVRAEDLQRVAARYLRPEHCTVGVLQP
ncbi:MAG: insulinase family protein, partial [Magnetococcales bacterium]|nr:insulinase family protein [Magnetococcales bacterium]